MHTQDLTPWLHHHRFDTGNRAAERGTQAVMWITAVMMVVEIVAGMWFNSMALLADGWHMSSHAFAIGLSAFSYWAARRYANDARFAFGSWKIEVLGGFASALFLLGVALMMVFGSIERMVTPQPIHFKEAIVVAIVGLVVNVVCAWILGRAHDHGHSHGHSHAHDHAHGHDHQHGGHDLNLRSAYLHVIADAATSVLAILALFGGLWFGWSWLDPVMGVVGAVLVGSWALGLLRETSRVLLDREMDHPVVEEVREVVEALNQQEGGETRIADLHVWRVGTGRFALILSLVTCDASLTPERVKTALGIHEELVHCTVEIHLCPHPEWHHEHSAQRA